MTIWRKSSHSGSGGIGGQECVEVAGLSGGIGIRDSKAPDGGHLTLTPRAFTALIHRAKQDKLNL
ncbi:DUF397 domain-containing protein [Actinomadura formosensis]|uniref:DUF397 domain-containing protein n=1 Tax=Actinomadura formosensis TaxID=60706 RepID=UPI000833D7A5|nr:DUF397 domain-containing protein [Actinomadura formosensis]